MAASSQLILDQPIFHSINLVVRSDGLQQDGLGTFVLDEFEDKPQVVTGTTGPGTRQFAFEFVEELQKEAAKGVRGAAKGVRNRSFDDCSRVRV